MLGRPATRYGSLRNISARVPPPAQLAATARSTRIISPPPSTRDTLPSSAQLVRAPRGMKIKAQEARAAVVLEQKERVRKEKDM